METLTEALVNVLREPPAGTCADAADLRPALADAWANVAAPVAVITLRDAAGRSHATTVTAFTSISFTPPVLMFALAHTSSFLARICEDSRVALSVLAHEQAHVAAACAAKAEDRLRDVTTLDQRLGAGRKRRRRVVRLHGQPHRGGRRSSTGVREHRSGVESDACSRSAVLATTLRLFDARRLILRRPRIAKMDGRRVPCNFFFDTSRSLT